MCRAAQAVPSVAITVSPIGGDLPQYSAEKILFTLEEGKEIAGYSMFRQHEKSFFPKNVRFKWLILND